MGKFFKQSAAPRALEIAIVRALAEMIVGVGHRVMHFGVDAKIDRTLAVHILRAV